MPKKTNPHRKLPRQEQWDLDVEIGFIEGVIRRAPNYLEALQILGDNYTRRGRLDDGLRVDEQLGRLRPNDPMAHYNLACSYSLTEQCEAAAQALARARKLGFRDFKWTARDPDLLNLRRHSAFKKIQNKIRVMQVRIS